MRDGLAELREKIEEMGEELAAGKASRAHVEARLAGAETTLRNAREGQPAIESTAATIHVRPSPASRRTDGGDTANRAEGGGGGAGEGPRRLWTRRPQWGRGRRAGVEQGLLMLLGTVPAGVAYWACLVLDDARLRVVGRAMFPAILLFLRHDGV